MTKLLQSVTILRLKPGDVIVAEIDDRPAEAIAAQISEQLRDRFPGHEIIVTHRVRLSVQRSDG